jgi:hypothetical protein
MSSWFQPGLQPLNFAGEQPAVEPSTADAGHVPEAGPGEPNAEHDINQDILFNLQAELDYHKRAEPRMRSQVSSLENEAREWRSKYNQEAAEHQNTATALNLILRQTAAEINHSIGLRSEIDHLRAGRNSYSRGMIRLDYKSFFVGAARSICGNQRR